MLNRNRKKTDVSRHVALLTKKQERCKQNSDCSRSIHNSIDCSTDYLKYDAAKALRAITGLEYWRDQDKWNEWYRNNSSPSDR